ncbi:MAG: hypothetical protein SF069_03050 [Phycisphaerae bacterium]|nr:hypothetical protein [Phycisphaerae bacterium]
MSALLSCLPLATLPSTLATARHAQAADADDLGRGLVLTMSIGVLVFLASTWLFERMQCALLAYLRRRRRRA